MVWQHPNRVKYTIKGERIDLRLKRLNIDVKVAVTCFENPHEGVEVQKPGRFTECRKPIVNRVFFLRGDYDEADIIEVIQDEIIREEALKKV